MSISSNDGLFVFQASVEKSGAAPFENEAMQEDKPETAAASSAAKLANVVNPSSEV